MYCNNRFFLIQYQQMAYQTYKGKRSVRRKIGFRARMATVGGRDVINRRRAKGRHVLAYDKPIR